MESKVDLEVVAERHSLLRRLSWNARFLAGRGVVLVRDEGPGGIARGAGRWVDRQRHRFPARARLAVGIRRHPGRRSVAFLDVDGLTQVDERLGRPAAVMIVEHLESSVRSTLRPGDWYYRHGADEFVLVMNGAGELTSARVAGLVEDFATRSGSRCSFGIAESQPGEPAALLLLRAEAAMHTSRNVAAVVDKLPLGLTARAR